MLARFERENTNNIEETPTKMKNYSFYGYCSCGTGRMRRQAPATAYDRQRPDGRRNRRRQAHPEVMWKMSRAGSSSLSPDGKTLLYAQTDYNMAQNRGVTTIWVQDMASGAVTRLTDTASNNADPKWSADGRKIYFLSDRSGSMQVWRMNAAGGDATQVTAAAGARVSPTSKDSVSAPMKSTSGGYRPCRRRGANRRTYTRTWTSRRPASTTT